MKFILDFVMPISIISPVPAASTDFLKQVCVVAKPKGGQEGHIGEIFECTSMSQVGDLIANTNGALDQVQQLFNAGMSKVYILLASDLDLDDYLGEGKGSDFYTLLVSSDFSESDIEDGISTPAIAAQVKIQDITYTAKTAGSAGNSITITYVNDGTGTEETVNVAGTDITVHMEEGVSTAQNIADAIEESVSASGLVSVEIDDGDETDTQEAVSSTPLTGGADEVPGTDGMSVGNWEGVLGVSSDDTEFLESQSAIQNRVAFFGNDTNKAKNMFYAFGKLLSSTNWTNQQYITMPFDDGIDNLGEANSLFDDKISFVLSDDEFSKRLALFAVGKKAIVSPYILKNLRVDLQSATLTWISVNHPQYTVKEASLLETRLQDDVINTKYIQRDLVNEGSVSISLVESNFVANATIDISEPTALWRVFAEMRQAL